MKAYRDHLRDGSQGKLAVGFRKNPIIILQWIYLDHQARLAIVKAEGQSTTRSMLLAGYVVWV